jgi:hypothetical protein
VTTVCQQYFIFFLEDGKNNKKRKTKPEDSKKTQVLSLNGFIFYG